MKYKKYKKEFDYSYTLGTTTTIELLLNKSKHCEIVYLHSKINNDITIKKLISLCDKNKIEIVYNDTIFNVISNKENNYCVGVFKKYNCVLEKDKNHIVLVNVSNSGNLGTILRSCLGFGINNVAIILPAVDIFSPDVIRSSMGAIFSINIELFNSFDEYKDVHKNNIIYPFILQAKTSLIDVSTPDKSFSLVFGNESRGLDKNYLNIGQPIIIKHTNAIDSLNLSISVAIALFHFCSKH
ncbi:hypothetical protein FACS189459_4690 [Bacilli bacterium]|nr:hypothetical protein FACS189459_4690 [Bacilli bacterium]